MKLLKSFYMVGVLGVLSLGNVLVGYAQAQLYPDQQWRRRPVGNGQEIGRASCRERVCLAV